MKGFLILVSAALAGFGSLAAGFGSVAFQASSPAPASRPAYNVTDAGIGHLLRPATFMETASIDAPVSAKRGAGIYQIRCVLCHGADFKGVAPSIPSLIGVTNRLTSGQILMQIHNGKGRMLAFPDLSNDDLHSLLLFLKAHTKPAPSGKPGA